MPTRLSCSRPDQLGRPYGVFGVNGRASAVSGEKASFMAESPGGEAAPVPPRWRSRSAEPVSPDRCDTSRQFRRKYPGFRGLLERQRSVEISGRWPCDLESSEAQ